MIFYFKKFVASFLKPFPISFFFITVGLFFLWGKKRVKLGKILITSSFAILAICSFFPLPNLLLAPLERKYPPMDESVFHSQNPPRYVVVLGGGHVHDPRFPATAQISSETLARLIEGIRIQRKIEGAKLLLSGGSVFSEKSNARIMAEIAVSIGVKEKDMLLETQSRDTKDEARIISEIIGNQPFILVTSARHMPRSMALFKKMKTSPIPAPTAHAIMEEKGGFDWRSLLPGPGNVVRFDYAMHEYLGMAWAKLRGQM